MQILEPDQSKFLLSILLPVVQNEHHLTRKVIDAIPIEKADYRLDSVSKTAFELASHIALVEAMFLKGIATGTLEGIKIALPDSVRNTQDLITWSDRTVDEICADISQLTGEQLSRILKFGGTMQLPAVLFLQLVIGHSIHHRGQLSCYLRPMGARVPAIYGESADSAAIRKEKEALAQA